MIDTVDDYSSLLIDNSVGKEPALLHTAESYLRGYARHPWDRGVNLLPQDQRWTLATKDLYNELPEEDQAIIDSFAPDATPLTGAEKHARNVELKRLARQLICKTGLESRYTLLTPQERKGINHVEGHTGKTDL